MSLQCHIISLSELAQAQGLLEQAYSEVAPTHKQYPLKIDWASYQRFYDAGVLCAVGCFSDTSLVGYGVLIKLPELWGLGGFVADVVSIYLLPEYRKGLNGFRLIRFVENAARVLECKEIKVSVSRRSKDKLGRPRTNLFAKLGYSFREAVLVKRL